jgi:pyruvate formate lyase activating enzyme
VNKGIVFDIQKFSLHDGPGIRTTVFLKGCPLRCLWCHNPESQSFKVELAFKKDKCMMCGACEAVCPLGVHRVTEGLHTIDYSKCNISGKCIEACTYDALKLYGKVMTVEEIISDVIKDIKYYEKSGGGITISGGEPLGQPSFTREILKAAKEKSIHTCIETTGYASKEIIAKLLPYVDLFLFDYKATDAVKHEELTGVSNELILQNLQFIYEQGASIILRCPLISGVNDSQEHLQGIANMSKKYPLLKGIELLPYHDMGKGKYKELGREYTLGNIKNTSEEQKKKWISFFQALGYNNIKLS